MRPSLDEYALRLAAAAASRSEDPRRQVGAAVLGRRGEVLALGYNGPPAGIDLVPWEWSERALANSLTIHAEVNALRYVRPGEGRLMASTYGPCAECIKATAAMGIKRIVFRTDSQDRMNAEDMADRLGITMEKL